jgi:hypothetical protein
MERGDLVGRQLAELDGDLVLSSRERGFGHLQLVRARSNDPSAQLKERIPDIEVDGHLPVGRHGRGYLYERAAFADVDENAFTRPVETNAKGSGVYALESAMLAARTQAGGGIRMRHHVCARRVQTSHQRTEWRQ